MTVKRVQLDFEIAGILNWPTILVKSNGTLGLFWQFHRSFPPPPRTMLGRCAQSVPLEATLYGGEGGGPSLGKRAAFIIEQGAIMKTKQIFKVYHILLTRIVVRTLWRFKMLLFHRDMQYRRSLVPARFLVTRRIQRLHAFRWVDETSLKFRLISSVPRQTTMTRRESNGSRSWVLDTYDWNEVWGECSKSTFSRPFKRKMLKWGSENW